MSTHLSFEVSKKIFELVGEYETEQHHQEMEAPDCLCGEHGERGYILTPSPAFSELVRVMPKIGEKKMLSHGGWRIKATTSMIVGRMVRLYMYADTEPEGMAAVEKYLDELLK